MRIVSKFRDYYDSLQRLDMEKDDVWVRNTIVKSWKDVDSNIVCPSCVDGPNSFGEIASREGKKTWEYVYEPFIIGFCGKLYPGIRIAGNTSSIPDFDKFSSVWTFYDVDTLSKFTKDRKIKIQTYRKTVSFDDRDDGWSYSKDDDRVKFGYSDIKKWMEGVPDSSKLFRQFNTPTFLVTPRRIRLREKDGSCEFKRGIVINPCLQTYEFFRIVDHYKAWQEIDMYRHGVLGVGNPEMVNISDKDMIVKKGFDDWSFRKMGKKSKRKKK